MHLRLTDLTHEVTPIPYREAIVGDEHPPGHHVRTHRAGIEEYDRKPCDPFRVHVIKNVFIPYVK